MSQELMTRGTMGAWAEAGARTIDRTYDRLPIARRAEPADRWRDVAIGDAQVCADAAEGHACLRVKADVRLRALLPADVRVELVELDATRVPVNFVRRQRMFSAVPLQNGTFRYEAELPLGDDAAAHAWVVRVVPSDLLAHAPDARPVERWIGVEQPTAVRTQ